MATGTNYIPARDADYNTWLNAYSTYLDANYAALGVTAPQAANMASLVTIWNAAYIAATAGSTRGPMSVQAKDTARANATLIARQIAVQVNQNPSVTEEQKVALGITVRKTTKTPVPQPTTSPILTFIAATPLQHTLRFADQLTPASRAQPFGAIALQLEVWISATPPVVGAPPNQTLTITKNPFAVDFPDGSQGKTAYYSGNWRTRRGDLGPDSSALSNVII